MPKPVIIKLATLAPVGSPWYEVLQDIVREWEEITDNQVQVKMYPGGVAGDERDLIIKMRLNHIQAAAMTATGISEVDKGIWGLSIPLILEDYNQLDWLRSQIEGELTRRLEEAGFLVLAWADVGWVYWFSRDPVYVPQDLQPQRIFTWSGGPNVEGLWKFGGFHSVSIAATDVLPALQTGLIDALGTSPLTAATFQWFGITKYMNPIKWSVMTGAILITKQAWSQIPAELRPKLLAVAQKHEERVQNEIRHMDDEAIRIMKEYGLQVVEVTPDQRAQWHSWLEPHYNKLRGLLTDTTMFDWVMELRKELPPPSTSSP
ncbi:MAG: TRAP transporter substrate-binding protein DctP [Candidatus Neomarinimicrobiota bacterium]